MGHSVIDTGIHPTPPEPSPHDGFLHKAVIFKAQA